jgi:hypothetical protein
VAIATVVLIYVVVWSAIGSALDYLMSQVMMPSSLLVVGIAIAIARTLAEDRRSRAPNGVDLERAEFG